MHQSRAEDTHGLHGQGGRHHGRWRRHRQGRGAALPRRAARASCSPAPAGRCSRRRATSWTRPASAWRSSPGRSRAASRRRRWSAAAVERFGGVDVLVNSTGIFRIVPFLEQTEEHLEEALGSILYPTYWVSQAAAQAMRERGGGAIVSVGSMWAMDAIATTPTSAYSAAQAGRHALTKNLALELAPREHPRQHGRAGLRRDAGLRAVPLPRGGAGRCWTPSTASTRSAAAASRRTWSRRSRSWPATARAGSPARRCPVDGGVLAGRSPALQAEAAAA